MSIRDFVLASDKPLLESRPAKKPKRRKSYPSSRSPDMWSDSTIREIENHIKLLHTRIPILKRRLKIKCSYGTSRGSDVEICMTDKSNSTHFLRFEVEQYASGRGLDRKVKTWAKRHFSRPNTTTVVISLVLQALRKQLIDKFSIDKFIEEMVFSSNFRIFPGIGDGKVTEELKLFITMWVEQKL